MAAVLWALLPFGLLSLVSVSISHSQRGLKLAAA